LSSRGATIAHGSIKRSALGNRTPRKAVRDRDGREAVEALVAQIERDGKHMSPPLAADIVRELRETLGLGDPKRNGPPPGGS